MTERKGGRGNRIMSAKDDEILKSLWFDTSFSRRDLMRVFKCSGSTIDAAVDRLGLPYRNDVRAGLTYDEFFGRRKRRLTATPPGWPRKKKMTATPTMETAE